MKRDSGVEYKVLSCIDIMTNSLTDFDNLLLSGEDDEFTKKAILYIASILY